MYHKVYKKILSNVCCLCDTQGQIGLDLCHACHKMLPHNHFYCWLCAAPFLRRSTDSQQICGHCLSSSSRVRNSKQAGTIDHAIIPYLYRPPIDYMIKRLKFSEQLKYGRLLGELLADAIEAHYCHSADVFPDLIIPVPVHKQRLLQRGFNQAEQIATTVARRFNRHCTKDTITRTLSRQSQSTLSAAQREANIRQSFEITGNTELKNLHIAVIDDVYTTGATAKAISRRLKAAGAAKVSIWAVARTP